MAKITNPLMSISATGTIARKITFSGSTGGTRAFLRPTPKGTGTPAHKSRYSDGCAAWQLLSPAEKAAWSETGEPRRLNGFQAFMSAWLLETPSPYAIWDGGAATWDGGTANWD